jgi:hypothetical protein
MRYSKLALVEKIFFVLCQAWCITRDATYEGTYTTNVEHSRSFRTHEKTISEMLCSCAEYEVQYILLRT